MLSAFLDLKHVSGLSGAAAGGAVSLDRRDECDVNRDWDALVHRQAARHHLDLPAIPRVDSIDPSVAQEKIFPHSKFESVAGCSSFHFNRSNNFKPAFEN